MTATSLPGCLNLVHEQVPGVNILDFSKEKDVVKKLKEMTVHGPDVGIESVGCHYNKSLTHKIETAIGLETDTGDIMNEIIQAVRKVASSSLPQEFQLLTHILSHHNPICDTVVSNLCGE